MYKMMAQKPNNFTTSFALGRKL